MDSHVGWHALDHTVEVTTDVRSLAALRKGARGVVSSVGLNGAAAATIGDVAGSTIARRLLEVGFVPGERIEVIEEIRPGGDPIAVRIGSSMFALRRREAQAVLVRLEPTEVV
ncbi:MAG TPA: FeoA family protein [Steroidobacteraceae bacterium]|jgi:ferrous iron transport protein A